MKTEKTIYETGATSHAVNDLVLFTDNTRELVEIRDRIYANGVKDNLNSKNLAYTFEQLFTAAKKQYIKEMPTASNHIKSIPLSGQLEFAELYAKDFNNWKQEHGYN